MLGIFRLALCLEAMPATLWPGSCGRLLWLLDGSFAS
jgi:hypothetical protein